MRHSEQHYEQADKLVHAIETELKRLNRWSDPIPDHVFDNMGAFGQNSMAFEQWIQFVLLERLRSIINNKEEFPKGSSVAVYAVRNFDGDSESDSLISLLSQLDQLVESIYKPLHSEENPLNQNASKIELNSEKLPEVVYALIEVLPQFEGDDLESQLQSYDVFLNVCSASVRPELCELLKSAATKTENEHSRKRIEAAAQSIANGGTAATPYNHDEAMKKFMEEHKRNFPFK